MEKKKVDCVEMNKSEEEIGYRKNKKGMGSYDNKKSGVISGKQATPGRNGSVNFG
jgi:hypothetical protein